MQKKLAALLFSTRLTAVLFIVFAIAMATGTILDASQDTSPTPYTRYLIYNAWWFEAIMALFVVNFCGNIFRFKLYKKEKWATLVLHLSFILILIGAFITRYYGYEGMMPIREGATENQFLSRENYLTVYIDGDYKIDGVPQRLPIEREVDFSPRLNNKFNIKTKYDQQPVSIELVNFIAGAEEDIVPSDDGEEYLKIVEAGGGQPHNHFVKVGEVANLHNILISLNKPIDGAVNINYDKSTGQMTMTSPYEGEYMQMATMINGKVVKDSLQPLMLRSRYIIGGLQMVFPKPVVKGNFDIVKKSKLLKGDEEGIKLKITSNNETKTIGILGGQGFNNAFKQMKIAGLDIAIKYGAKIRTLPFSIKLNDFIAERYPGTEKSFSSFESKVTVVDEEQDDYDYRIYMNNVLDHKGFRFFQASYDPDEKGTRLSVNHDFWGTWITYIGYFLLYFGLMAILVVKHTRFDDLRKYVTKIKKRKAKLIGVFIMLFTFQLSAQEQHSNKHSANDGHASHAVEKPSKVKIDSVLKANVPPSEHADKFGHLVIQDIGGRMMPLQTYGSELLRKLSRKDSYEGLNSNQVLLSIHESPMLWYNVPVIYLKPLQTDSIKTIIGIPKTRKYATLSDFFTDRGEYKLTPYLEDAYKTQIPNGHQKEFKKADQRVNLLYNTIEGMSLRIFPIPEDENNKWISPVEFRRDGFRKKIKDSLYGNFINSGFSAYLFTLNEAKKTGNFEDANKLLNSFRKTQEKYGASVMLSESKVNTEIKYNKYDVFKKLYRYYLLMGAIMFVFVILQLFYTKSKFVNYGVVTCRSLVIMLFVIHLGGLITRWYISGHAPWSDTYETMLYVAWSAMFFGLAFGKDSDLTIASTAFVASIILFFAHQNWLDPAIANLVPVLNSYWLMIHVAVIVASYGPFILGMILGLVALFLMIATTEKNKAKMDLNIKELTAINEMALTVGLVMLAIGNFLGGMWANESWGRYWGWDPKETWALISIMIYAFVIHMRFVPGLRGRWFYSLMSILAFASIMMTYFGVNFYLSGLHSYASGDQIMSAKFIGITLAVIAIVAFFAYRKYKKFYVK